LDCHLVISALLGEWTSCDPSQHRSNQSEQSTS